MNTAIPGAAGVSVISGAEGVYLAAGRVIATRKERSPLRIAANKREVAEAQARRDQHLKTTVRVVRVERKPARAHVR
jgi:hypothetical protein